MKKMLVIIASSFSLFSANLDWSFPPSPVSTVGHSVENPKIAVDSNGNTIALWIDAGLLKSRYKLENMPWSSEVTLSGMGASSPNIVMDANGNSTASWVENGVVKAASKTLNGNWSSSVSLSGSNAAHPSLAIDAQGNVVVAWARNGDVQTATKLFGGNWQNSVSINANGSDFPHVSIGGAGSNARVAVVWQAVANQVNVVYIASKLLSQTGYGGKQMISDPSHQAGYPKVSVDQYGNTSAAWFAYDVIGNQFSRVLVQSVSMTSAELLGGLTTLSEEGNGNPANLSLAIRYDLMGNAIALWSTVFGGQNYAIQSAVKPIFGNWGAPVSLVDENLFSYNAHLALNSLGDALAVYMFNNGINILIQSSEIDITGFTDTGWLLPITLSDSAYNAKPHVAMSVKDGKMYASAIWLGNTGLNNSAVATVGAKDLPFCPSNLAVMQGYTDYGVFNEYHNVLSWDASSTTNVRGYLIFRNGQFLQEVNKDVLMFVDNNRVQNGPVVYGVAAVDDQNTHSIIKTINFP